MLFKKNKLYIFLTFNVAKNLKAEGNHLILFGVISGDSIGFSVKCFIDTKKEKNYKNV